MESEATAVLPHKFTVRAYGILVYENKILLCDEKIGDFAFTKFPGGGVEFGEGPRECIVREIKEELNVDAETGAHIYTTDSYVQSAIAPEEQVIAIYFEARLKVAADVRRIPTEPVQQDFRGKANELRFRWVAIAGIRPEALTFELDRRALQAFLGIQKV